MKRKTEERIPFSIRLTPTEHAALTAIAAKIGYNVNVTRVIHEAIKREIARAVPCDRCAGQMSDDGRFCRHCFAVEKAD